jgi:hypothetical protein
LYKEVQKFRCSNQTEGTWRVAQSNEMDHILGALLN